MWAILNISKYVSPLKREWAQKFGGVHLWSESKKCKPKKAHKANFLRWKKLGHLTSDYEFFSASEEPSWALQNC